MQNSPNVKFYLLQDSIYLYIGLKNYIRQYKKNKFSLVLSFVDNQVIF